MPDTPPWPFSEKSLAVTLMVLARYLASRDPRFVDYIDKNIKRGAETGLSDDDLAFLKTVLASLKAAQG